MGLLNVRANASSRIPDLRRVSAHVRQSQVPVEADDNVVRQWSQGVHVQDDAERNRQLVVVQGELLVCLMTRQQDFEKPAGAGTSNARRGSPPSELGRSSPSSTRVSSPAQDADRETEDSAHEQHNSQQYRRGDRDLPRACGQNP